MEKTWESRAALYELLARTFLFVEREVVSALTSGDYADAIAELVDMNGIALASEEDLAAELGCYLGKDDDEVLHALREEYTRLYLNPSRSLVAPYAGVWESLEKGQKPLLFVSRGSMAVERFMGKCGIVQGGNSNDPLDHIGSMLEFLMHLCTLKAKLVEPPEGVEIPEDAYEAFYKDHFIAFAQAFADKTIDCSNEPFFAAGARVLRALPSEPL